MKSEIMTEIVEKKISLGGEEISLFLRSYSEHTSNKKYSEQHKIGRELLKYALKDKLDFNESMITKNKYGKPKLRNFSKIHFNISHTEKTIMLGLAKVSIGVDVEDVYEFSEAMITRVFSDEERKNSDQFEDKNEYFTRLWTLKESFYKCLGSGLKLPLSSLSIPLNENDYPIKIETAEAYFYQDKTGDSVYSVCCLRDYTI